LPTSRRWKAARGKRERGRFLALPYAVLTSAAYLSLSPHGIKLLIDLGVQYNGSNNGDLSAAWKLMRPRGWRSEETLAKAKRELLQTQLIVETRKGWRPNRASPYALTFFALDYCDGKLDIAPAGFPYGAWKLMERLSRPMAHARIDTVRREDSSLPTPI
jgi:hypothetical protein